MTKLQFQRPIPRDVTAGDLVSADTIVRCAGWSVRYTVHLYDCETGVLEAVLAADLDSVCGALRPLSAPYETGYRTGNSLPPPRMLDGDQESARWLLPALQERGVRVLPVAVMAVGTPLQTSVAQFTSAVVRGVRVQLQRFAIARLSPWPGYSVLLPIPALRLEQLHHIRSPRAPEDAFAVQGLAVLEGQEPGIYCDGYGRVFLPQGQRYREQDRDHMQRVMTAESPEENRASRRESLLYEALIGEPNLQAVFTHNPQTLSGETSCERGIWEPGLAAVQRADGLAAWEHWGSEWTG